MLAAVVFILSTLPVPWTPASQPTCASVGAPTAVEAEVLFQFNDRIERYLLVHRAVERDVFGVEIAALIRERLRHILIACNDRVEDVLSFINEERLPGAPRPRINQPFPWELGSAMWPTVLDALPPLPEELQYRFADRDLVLIDMHADLVVDILVKALPPPNPSTVLSITADRPWTAGR